MDETGNHTMKKIAFLFAPMLAISACTSDTFTHSGFQTPTSSGEVGTSLSSATRRSHISASGDGYAYAVGIGSNNNFYGYSGIATTTSVSAPLSAGTATWSGNYALGRVRDISLSGALLRGIKSTETAALTLTADFEKRTLVGGTSTLSVNGAFSGSNLSGSVTYRGLDGSLTGLVGATGAVGAFHGNNATDIYAGGFIVGAP